jgi:ribonuclease R
MRAFGIKGDDRRDIKEALRELEKEERIVKQPGQTYALPDDLPSVVVAEVDEIDIDGDVFALPLEWNAERGKPPRIEIVPEKKGHPALKEKDRVLVRLKKLTDRVYEGRVIRRLDDEKGRVIGLVRQQKKGWLLIPTDKKAKDDFIIDAVDLGGAKDNDLAVGEIQPKRGPGMKRVRITEVIGRRDNPKAISLIALYEAGLNEKFPDKVIANTKGMKVPPLGTREDLRDVPLVTIDGADARDFDDAVFAEKTDGGYHLIVAIADVAHYVRFGSALDREAYKRGNSTYFPDRVVPMLPEALSNDLCSLRPNEDRASMGFHLYIDTAGNLTKYRVFRGLIRSKARLTYEMVQDAKDGNPNELTQPLMKDVIEPLYEAYDILLAAREKRGALELDLPERQILIDDKGNMTGVKNRARYDSHKLIEEFMIIANVAAASALEAKRAPCVYRVHDRPKQEKLDSAREFVETFGLSLPKGGIAKPAQINHILKQAAAMEYSHLISEVILRTQSQAVYAPDNIGHFGLALTKYAHFTSPIRRYADLLVHRSLIRAYNLGDDGIDQEEAATLEERAQHISQTERTSMEAERSAVDRFTATWLAEHINDQFTGKINGVTRFGLFVTLDENGADGLVPMRSLGGDFFVHDEKQHALVGRRTGRIYRLGAPVTVRIVEADPLTGSSVFEMTSHEGADLVGVKFPRSRPQGSRPAKGRKPGKNGPGRRKHKGPRQKGRKT